MTDEELIRRFVDGRDEHAFRQLYARHTPAVYGLLRRLAGPARDLADDVLQDAWLRAATAMHRFRGDSAFRTWLTGVALNCLRERRRARDRVDDGREPPEQMVPAEMTTLDVAGILDALGPAHREVLVLHDVEGYTHEEIASLLGIEIGTSKSRLSRARQLFRERWRGPVRQEGTS
jgi:RNA polymerase sigma-70 factor (ECF subfamily)